jgi:hypothetical protein
MRILRLAALATLGGCLVGEADPEEVALYSKNPTLDRVVIARIYQKTDWTLPEAGTTPAQRIAYVCDRIKPLHPTYVSGLIRLDDDAPMTADQVAIFEGIRQCMPDAKFDIVLNAEHYTDNQRHASGIEALHALQHRADEIKALGADIVFFDFFNVAYNSSPEHKGWYTDALTRGTDYIKSIGLKVAGNVWGFDLPPNTDFVALDNFDRNDASPPIAGFDFDKQQIAKFRGKPVMIHIENNPQKKDSKGLDFIDGSPAYRAGVVDKFAGKQSQVGFSYMFPVFFPLKCCVGTLCGPDKCDEHPSDRISYDASLDPGMMQKIKTGLGK